MEVWSIFETWWKMLQYVHEIPSQCADDVSTVLGVSVVNELPDIQFYPLSPPPPHLPNIVDTRFTRGSNCIHRTTLGCQFCGTVWPNCKTLDYFFLIALSSVGFVCQAIVWSDLHSWREVSWLLSCDVEHCCCPSPSKCDTLLGHVCFVGYTARVFLGGEIISPVSIWPYLCWLQWIKIIKMKRIVLSLYFKHG